MADATFSVGGPWPPRRVSSRSHSSSANVDFSRVKPLSKQIRFRTALIGATSLASRVSASYGSKMLQIQ